MSLAMSTLTEGWTVDDVLRCFPSSLDALNELGIDTCCGRHHSLRIAAANAQVSPEMLVEAIRPCTILFEASPTPQDSPPRES